MYAEVSWQGRALLLKQSTPVRGCHSRGSLTTLKRDARAAGTALAEGSWEGYGYARMHSQVKGLGVRGTRAAQAGLRVSSEEKLNDGSFWEGSGFARMHSGDGGWE